MHTFTRQLIIEERRSMLHDVHGEIHVDLEYCQPAIHLTDTEECAGWRRGNGGVWDVIKEDFRKKMESRNDCSINCTIWASFEGKILRGSAGFEHHSESWHRPLEICMVLVLVEIFIGRWTAIDYIILHQGENKDRYA